ncbi:MAG: hypothetical protein Q9170_005933 [Blastenia crenularia]
MAPSSKRKAKKGSDASESFGSLSIGPSTHSTPQHSRRPSRVGQYQSTPSTPQGRREIEKETSNPVSRTSSRQTSESAGYSTSDPIADASSSAVLDQSAVIPEKQAKITSSLLPLSRGFDSMDSKFHTPGVASSLLITKQKERTMQIAKEQQQALLARLQKNNLEMPPFEFLELIGKGAFALKVVDVDPHDFKVHYMEKDESIQTVLHEIKILTQLRDSHAKNINLIIDAFSVHSQLWIVTEYCPGGSLHTLMQGVGSKLEEKYIIPVARELAVALKAIHAAGIIHRDVKAANVMIHENGSLQLIDFGVAGLLQTSKDKRSTIIGTPHWMPPEMSSQLVNQGPSTVDYATEIDVWAYGCTLYEIATGNPPYHRAEPGRKLTMMLKRSAPTLKEKDFSDGLVDLVDYIMKTSPRDRPSMEAILQHAYVFDTEGEYPTKSLADLVKNYYRWEYSGGQRVSLFMPGGAEAAPFPTLGDDDEEWNFSTTLNFDAQNTFPYLSGTQHLGDLSDLNQFPNSDFIPRPNAPINPSTTSGRPGTALHKAKPSMNFSFSMSDAPEMDDPTTPTSKGGVDLTVTESNGGAASAPATERNVERGEKSLLAIFDQNAPDYQYGGDNKSDDQQQGTASIKQAGHIKPVLDRSKSDLPLRNAASGIAVHKEVDKSGIVKTPSIDLSSVNTIKANRMNRSGLSLDRHGSDDNEGAQKSFLESTKRATMEWTFATAQETPDTTEAPILPRQAQRGTLDWSFATAGAVHEEDVEDGPLPARPPLRHMVTQPIGVMDPRPKSVLDLDELWESEPSYDSSALNTAPASDDEAFAAYDLSDANEPTVASLPGLIHSAVTEPSPTEEPKREKETSALPGDPHPYSSLRAPAKLKVKMLRAFVFHYELDAQLAEKIVIGDGADPQNLTHGSNEDYALECVEVFIAQRHSDMPVHVRMAMRRDIMDARTDVFTRYLTGGEYPFEKYYSAFDAERMGEVYESDGVHSENSTEYEGEVYEYDGNDGGGEDGEEQEEDPVPRLQGVDVKALQPGAPDEALRREFVVQLDQYGNRVLPWAERKIDKMLAKLGVEDAEDGVVGVVGNGGLDVGGEDEGAEGGDEA